MNRVEYRVVCCILNRSRTSNTVFMNRIYSSWEHSYSYSWNTALFPNSPGRSAGSPETGILQTKAGDLLQTSTTGPGMHDETGVLFCASETGVLQSPCGETGVLQKPTPETGVLQRARSETGVSQRARPETGVLQKSSLKPGFRNERSLKPGFCKWNF